MASLIFVIAALVVSFFLIAVYLLSYDKPSLKVVYKTFRRDVKFAVLILSLWLRGHICRIRNITILDHFRNVVRKNRNKICFIFEDQKWSFGKVDEYSNQVAHFFASQGYRKGDEVALFMENRPEYVCLWLGLAKIGVVTALINTNLRKETLAHSINILLNCKAIIFGPTLEEAVKEVIPYLDKKSIDYFSLAESSLAAKNLDNLLKNEPVHAVKHKVKFLDKLIYIYTSGTTGLPKAAIIKHSRMLMTAIGFNRTTELRDDDICYNPLPMYHTAGGILLLAPVIAFGRTMVLQRKFSASNFWKEAIKHKATVSQYIGETCRFLLNQPSRPEDTQHSIRFMIGNGLRSHIWKEFQTRFRIKKIIEIYGSTEGNANVGNMTGKVGAVGFLSRIFSRLSPVQLIRANPETGEPIRDHRGLCIRCKPGEPGEIVAKIFQNDPVAQFEGYVDKKATKKKIVNDCFNKGDMAFLSGDMLVMDEEGYLYFMDRTGDTFRWRGENVSSVEVENAITKIVGHTSCAVYGAQVPNAEGRAGMAAIQVDGEKIDVNFLYKELKKTLPSYAIPVFIRLCKDIEATGTYKLGKTTLQKEGYNLQVVSDPLYFLDYKENCYVPITEDVYTKINEGKMKL